MIRVGRSTVHPPEILVDPRGAGASERRKAAEFYAERSQPTDGKRRKAFSFKVYRDDAVKSALEKLFHGKCAYCEAFYAATQPVDVEHWRPKGGVDLDPWETISDFPGYPWLASEWENLLPSCIDCNRARTQRHSDGSSAVTGKGMRFPVEQGTTRATDPSSLANERPLLLNPCDDEPGAHLGPAPDEAAVFVPRSERGRMSILIYGLNRAALVVARRERASEVRRHLWLFRDLTRSRQRSTEERVIRLLERLMRYELRILARLQHDDQPFAMMSRHLIDQAMERWFAKQDSGGR